ncbi:MgtC/SapB family protein [Costertonia aggregata]|uniref:MgtC/SapB family protein n=1 Tax=Costertonia aggregata TaxID=343403 RepID=A0A7H9ASZ9_9FLAO|nr:MgtC/SapB family protein [Costertonia aggregata]QLG46537.1 MgtC/SapB family protein [Costertonia aggregata]
MDSVAAVLLLLNDSTEGFGQVPHWDFDKHFLFKIGLAALAGLLIGLEREYKNKDAGLKTNMLVSIGACAFVLLSLQFHGQDDTDLSRVLSQVVTGIGFLGAGVILKEGGSVKGLTTAATVWCSAAAGCIAAFYLITELLSLTGFVVIVNIIFGVVDSKVSSN